MKGPANVSMGRSMKKVLLLVAILVLAQSAWAADENGDDAATPNPDPWMKVNRATHKFNHFFDKILLRPAAKVYTTIVPRFARHGVTRFFENLGDVNSSLNCFLQGKPREGFTDIGRIAINSTIGIGGLFDPATAMGLKDQDEDFGQTFAVWGLPRGPYVELPFLGPSTLEDAFGRPFNTYVDPVTHLYPVSHRNSLYALRVVSDRAALIPMESAVFGDEYIFYRDAYLQHRNFVIKDGKVKDTFGDDF